MPKKKSKKSGKKGSKGKGSKKKDGEKKKKKGPTRCPPDFSWEQRPLLVEAAYQNDVTRCKKLLARGEDPNEAFHYAIGRGRLDVVNVFIQAGADLHTAIKEGDYYTPPADATSSTKKSKGSGKKGSKKGSKKKKKKK
eukprot:m.847013 g.847013  ORF g.847013 m.847013 type:complete len:138 (+) comp23479_c0_seq2:350-763(+)